MKCIYQGDVKIREGPFEKQGRKKKNDELDQFGPKEKKNSYFLESNTWSLFLYKINSPKKYY